MTNSVRTSTAAETARPEPGTGQGWPDGTGPGGADDSTICDVDVIRVSGGARLEGRVHVVGAKNSALKLMAAALLAPGRSVITNVPRITDIAIMAEVLRRLGCAVSFADDEGADGGDDGPPRSCSVTIDVPTDPGTEADYDLVRRLRASICVLGPLLARRGYVRVAHPGGDAIGSRGLDMHVAGLARMGAEISGEHGFVIASAPRGLHGATIWLDFPSVGATENLVMAAVLARGVTEIDNAAREPEIVDICEMLTQMGARIDGAGTSMLRIEGVPELRPVRHATVGDRIVAGTWAFAAAMTRGDVTVTGADPAFLEIALDKLVSAGCLVETRPDAFRVQLDRRPSAVDVVTLPFPGFATDLLPMAIGLASVSEGASLVTENIFDGRFMFVNEMARLGADIKTDGHHAVVRGRERLSSAPVRATDIRAGAGLVIAGLCADGVTEVSHVHHVDRGYPDFIADLRSLGVEVERATAPEEPAFTL
ncbi:MULTISPECIES: UDP-N-acetylglucosamine 1-carboxyvinyltransferase [unclassified Plantactinospora]|uniref:UDP-N-acetylglucosamine 1-carboxyvinyltransferase n=1 Tax=unclassified Plantactinospora TaxID=2631981 RepID=UPI000D15BD89|nr:MULTISPECIES: UDP-N-acetylglucosamine 1-carboxyvinyltransferase [unclassified Plantactinospora]AVT31498.1 UDP-N-acetylglucosamine 1-carboxyvinyltransferase [Plantactinospora sp. BC1]AVT38838.1 UDP-N-acetylglucosamine 1-carboxyvinyltransferase [Plantactinospora sp. BB1]